ncbi:MAG: tRNA (adenosine(37)-N6)-dimethylallyltransferase MiaA [Bacteroidetes bacterium GWE2_29_8]|nr:MAG: tRNA (adenosine(37)-N6)-dimethylallyltransferase MiaA [Bacteroidetes bacterium GWE2_29_8]OFY15746.1 MAG: tRNA (adenosine(37)-N6)-dimethylallyltransferase MiaA [Bacteroidetes bacterium GWF2_29_10]
MHFDLITILGPTASGKTKLAVSLANEINGEIISADSRQVYRNMDIGTGKDLNEYSIENKQIQYHLIDIANPGEEYNLFNFQNDFFKAYDKVISNNHRPILCGGTGLYIDCILDNYDLIDVPINISLRKLFEEKSNEELVNLLNTLKEVHNTTDTIDRERIVRAIEISVFKKENPNKKNNYPKLKSIIFGINCNRELIKKQINLRLINRLNNGMIEEVDCLLKDGVDSKSLIKYGLEYKFITMYLLNQISKEAMTDNLYTSICDFAKRQMTWFRRMEKNNHKIIWLDYHLSLEDKINKINEYLKF